ncbi:tRNA pseudouridine(38-40) synthase TruA [Pleurocapsa sp. CCALA 161]|uniref:tRNA pseudouridine(38-40) synthase TruA n=1 Tax=Pleurocapsa sp. CCALA 161 TaxID=2107688 RepID=UPI000D07C95A|nr:tRNA pseudouridine(38-40) synthase TruA [Pleurocapsa sp. CCALA 161]PSB08700.1 tRNA pseudouridine(38-40) synthase TruA [Pleurocapsa sp. CCALA 161]
MRIALLIQYLGTNFHGWQKQPNQVSVQGYIEEAIASVVNYRVKIYGAGRTDAGVHAAAQVAHFEYSGPIPAHKWSKIINSRLPEGILIRASAQVKDEWHARFSALWRRYRYTIYTEKRPNVFINQTCWHYYHSVLNEALIQQALNTLLGEHSFAAFKRSGSDRIDSQVEIQVAECYRQGGFLYLEIQANSFLYGMVRLLVGMLVEVGIGKRSPENFTEIWRNQRRWEVKYSAPAKGLCLLSVGYPEFPFAQSLWFDAQPTFHLAH